jgi:ribosomal-protein-alanine N-acetyltransferase
MSPLLGGQIMLRPLEPGDFLAWRAIRIESKDWLERWEPLSEPGLSDPVADADAFRGRCSAWERQRNFDTAYGFGLFLRDGTLVGEVSLGNVLRGPLQQATVGYWIGERWAGQSLVPAGVVLALRFGFDSIGLHRIEAGIVPRNTASRRVAEKLALREEGVALRLVQIRGVWEDHVRYAITIEEWRDRRIALCDQFITDPALAAPAPDR